MGEFSNRGEQQMSVPGQGMKRPYSRARNLVAVTLWLVLSYSSIQESSIASGQGTPILPEEARAIWNAPQRRNLDSYFPFALPNDVDEWQHRRAQLKQDLLVSLGLWPEPPRTPLNAVIHGTLEFEDYYLDKVYFESMPGFLVTGSLYRPRGQEGPFPAVLCPHGHFRDGRFNEARDNEIQAEIAAGAETLEPNARSILQARCVHLARMGFVVFHYDMIGYADSQQIPMSIAHGFAQRRPHLESDTAWGFFSPQAELQLQSIMGLQTWNSIRALDFLETLPNIDKTRIGVTGASGGGTQTFILGALDERVRVAFPAVMVSTAMQGGCTCENACCLRTHAGNVEFAAMFAPRPLAMTAANDWTKEMETKGFPELYALYAMLDSAEHVKLYPRLEFGHNYNSPSRQAMYEWFGKYLQPKNLEFTERPFEFLNRDRLTVFNDQHPPPASGEAFEADLLRRWSQVVAQSLGLDPNVPQVLTDEQRDAVRQGWRSIVGHRQQLGQATPELTAPPAPGVRFEFTWELNTSQPVKHTVIGQRAVEPCWQWLVVTADAADRDQYDRWLAAANGAGWNLMIVELSPGQVIAEGQPPQGNPLVNNGRRAAAYTLGYNRPLVARQTSNLIELVAWLRSSPQLFGPDGRIALCGLTPRGEALLAGAMVPAGQLQFLGVNAGNFRFSTVTEFEDAQFLPGATRFGDRDLLLALANVGNAVVFNSEPDQWPLWQRSSDGRHTTWVGSATEPLSADQVLMKMLDWLNQ